MSVRMPLPRPDPVPAEFVIYDADAGDVIDVRTGQCLSWHGTNHWHQEWVDGEWPAKSVFSGQGWYPA